MNTHKICSMNIHEIYDFSLVNYNEILLKENLFVLKQTLRVSNKNVVINSFNLHHFY